MHVDLVQVRLKGLKKGAKIREKRGERHLSPLAPPPPPETDLNQVYHARQVYQFFKNFNTPNGSVAREKYSSVR